MKVPRLTLPTAGSALPGVPAERVAAHWDYLDERLESPGTLVGVEVPVGMEVLTYLFAYSFAVRRPDLHVLAGGVCARPPLNVNAKTKTFEGPISGAPGPYVWEEVFGLLSNTAKPHEATCQADVVFWGSFELVPSASLQISSSELAKFKSDLPDLTFGFENNVLTEVARRRAIQKKVQPVIYALDPPEGCLETIRLSGDEEAVPFFGAREIQPAVEVTTAERSAAEALLGGDAEDVLAAVGLLREKLHSDLEFQTFTALVMDANAAFNPLWLSFETGRQFHWNVHHWAANIAGAL